MYVFIFYNLKIYLRKQKFNLKPEYFHVCRKAFLDILLLGWVSSSTLTKIPHVGLE